MEYCNDSPSADALIQIMTGVERGEIMNGDTHATNELSKSSLPTAFICMTDVWSTLTKTYLVYSIEDDNLHTIFLNFYHTVREAFYLWSERTSRYGPSLSLEDFSNMLKTCGLIDESHDAIILSAFTKAQMDPAMAWEIEELVFVEYFEALARVALQVVDTDGFTDHQKIRLVFNTVTDLQHHSSHK